MSDIEILPAQYLRIDLFPASVTSTAHGDGTIESVRVTVTDAHIYIFSDSPNGPVPTYRAVVQSYSVDEKNLYTVVTEDDETLIFRRTSGCGCGSRLRGYRPFPGTPVEARTKPNL